MRAIVDGFKGEVVFDPTEELCSETEVRIKEEKEKLQLLQTLKGKENVTLDGKKIHIYANIGSVGDVGYVLENDAEASVCSAVNFCIWEEMIFRQKKSSSRRINR